MIFKSLHENLVKKKINKSLELLNNQIRIKPNPIKTIGCIIDPMFPVEVNNFIKLCKSYFWRKDKWKNYKITS